jgi:propionyl-CoA carboxylase alpha chain
MSVGRIHRLLVANRGEIAVRVARTARRLGVETVGVYSEADVAASYLAAFDVAVAIGGRTPAESYLRGAAVIDAARRSGADAVHPGYGFLAENAEFAAVVIEAGLIWVGPTPEQIRSLGDKLAAKRAAVAAGVPTSGAIEVRPGAPLPAVDVWPVLVKAAAGGGGRGMRVVRDPSQLADAVEGASREAQSAFGDGAVFIEPFIEVARHVEVQIVGDKHGSVVHFGERECSIQRRNQKVLEEAPSPGIDAATRTALHDGALALAKHVGYENAGTVEFLVGNDGTIQFLEVNTRLQVEHPVTEAVTGVDLVELQLRVAAGEPLPITQDAIEIRGHAIEARLVAEDASAGWAPSIGPIHRFTVPDTVRLDGGFTAGDVVSADYDSLLAKVIGYGATRPEAVAALRRGLQDAELHGPATNRDVLVAVLAEPDFLAGETFTRYLEDHPDVVVATADDDTVHAHVAAAVLAAEHTRRTTDTRWSFAPSGWRNVRTQRQRSRWRVGSADASVEVEYTLSAAGDTAEMTIDGVDHRVGRRQLTTERWAIELDGLRREIGVHRVGDEVWTNGAGVQLSLTALPRFVDHSAEAMGSGPVAPLPGTIVSVLIEPGDDVAEGDALVVLEAMKMEHRITAPAPGRVTAVDVEVGQRVDAGQILVHLEHHDDD